MKKDQVSILIERRNEIDREILNLRNRKQGLDEAISLLQSGEVEKKEGVKDTILSLLSAAGQTGLNAEGVVSAATNKSIKLKKTTVSSMLSRMKAEKELVYDGHNYRLAQSYINGAPH